MPVELMDPGSNTRSVFLAQLGGMAQNRSFRTMALASADPGHLALTVPHPVFNLDLASIDATDFLEHATMTGWRYLISSGDEVIAGAEASASEPAGEAVFACTMEGSFVRSFSEVVARAESLGHVRSGRFALGLLRVPALYVVAAWFRDMAHRPDGDRFVALEPAPAPFRPGAMMRTRQFRKTLMLLKAAWSEGGSPSGEDPQINR